MIFVTERSQNYVLILLSPWFVFSVPDSKSVLQALFQNLTVCFSHRFNLKQSFKYMILKTEIWKGKNEYLVQGFIKYLHQGWQTFSVKNPIVNIFSLVCVAVSQLHAYCWHGWKRMKTAVFQLNFLYEKQPAGHIYMSQFTDSLDVLQCRAPLFCLWFSFIYRLSPELNFEGENSVIKFTIALKVAIFFTQDCHGQTTEIISNLADFLLIKRKFERSLKSNVIFQQCYSNLWDSKNMRFSGFFLK